MFLDKIRGNISTVKFFIFCLNYKMLSVFRKSAIIKSTHTQKYGCSSLFRFVNTRLFIYVRKKYTMNHTYYSILYKTPKKVNLT